MAEVTIREMSVRQLEARNRAIDAMAESFMARQDPAQAAAFAEVAVDAIIAAVTPDPLEMLPPGTPDPRD